MCFVLEFFFSVYRFLVFWHSVFLARTPRHSLCILCVLCHLCSSALDILQVQEMALLSAGNPTYLNFVFEVYCTLSCLESLFDSGILCFFEDEFS